MAIACVDWREADAGDLGALYAGEIDRWSTALGWETASSWDHIELGRRLGTVPGLLALHPGGAIAGWTFYLLHRGVLQIGGFVSGSELATAALLDGIFASEAAARAQFVTVFVFTAAPGLSSALAGRGLTVGAYEYLMKPLPVHPPAESHRALPQRHHQAGVPSRLKVSGAQFPGSPPRAPEVSAVGPGGPGMGRGHSPALRRWRARDREAVAALLGTAYPGADRVRPFAPGGTLEEWREYVGQLVVAAGCGTIMPDSCFVVPSAPDSVSGVVLVTRLAAATAHIAQLAVDPQAQHRGLGRLLVDAACASASDAGCDRMTLLVDGRNVAARRLYEAAGFLAVARFVSAGSLQPLRLTSVAVGRGADMRA